MAEEKKVAEPMATLSPLSAHNALAGVIQMYQGVVADHGRESQMYQATIRAQQAALEAWEKKFQEAEKKSKEELAAKDKEIAKLSNQFGATTEPG